jgi:hypothetical protein
MGEKKIGKQKNSGKRGQEATGKVEGGKGEGF